MRRMIEKVSHAPRLELFARHKTEGWNVWGNLMGSPPVVSKAMICFRPSLRPRRAR
jgi:N6-adenosine-specific RNA methylase IME4